MKSVNEFESKGKVLYVQCNYNYKLVLCSFDLSFDLKSQFEMLFTQFIGL